MYKKILRGDVLETKPVGKALPFVLYLMLLAAGYIFSGYVVQSLYNRERKLELELKALRAEAVYFSAQRMTGMRQSEIMKEIEKRGLDLKESLTPPVQIK